MEIIKPSYKIESVIDGQKILTDLERYGRVCYKSEGKITGESAERFLKTILDGGHESIIEHYSITVRFVCSRAFTHELVRHRLASYSQESQRYVNYHKNGLQFIRPPFWEQDFRFDLWRAAMQQAESYYNELITLGASPQEAREVLPNSTKTEIVVSANIREWRHILKLRTSKAAHPAMRELMKPLLWDLQDLIPILFDDIGD